MWPYYCHSICPEYVCCRPICSYPCVPCYRRAQTAPAGFPTSDGEKRQIVRHVLKRKPPPPLSPERLKSLTVGQMKFLTVAQLQTITPDQLEALSPRQQAMIIKYLHKKKLPLKQFAEHGNPAATKLLAKIEKKRQERLGNKSGKGGKGGRDGKGGLDGQGGLYGAGGFGGFGGPFGAGGLYGAFESGGYAAMAGHPLFGSLADPNACKLKKQVFETLRERSLRQMPRGRGQPSRPTTTATDRYRCDPSFSTCPQTPLSQQWSQPTTAATLCLDRQQQQFELDRNCSLTTAPTAKTSASCCPSCGCSNDKHRKGTPSAADTSAVPSGQSISPKEQQFKQVCDIIMRYFWLIASIALLQQQATCSQATMRCNSCPCGSRQQETICMNRQQSNCPSKAAESNICSCGSDRNPSYAMTPFIHHRGCSQQPSSYAPSEKLNPCSCNKE